MISKKTPKYCNKCGQHHDIKQNCQKDQNYNTIDDCQNDAEIRKLVREIHRKYSCSKPCLYPCIQPCPVSTEPDYIVVGLGTAGTLIVRALADKGASVVAFELGINHTGDPRVEGGIAAVFPPTGDASTISFSSKYATTKLVPDPVNAARLGQLILAEQYTAGTGGGGSSAHHYLVAVRGTKTYWDQIGVISGEPDIWSYSANLERMKSIETYTGTTQKPTERGESGNIMLTQVGGPLTDSPQLPFAQGLSSVTGAPILADYNVSGADTAISANQYFVYPPNGGRSYAINAYLPPDIMKFNGDSVNPAKYPFKVFFETTVTQIIFEGKQAVGVRYEEKEKDVKLMRARKGVILCAGAPGSAQILQLSGVGDFDLLDSLHIEKVLNNPNVGRGLQTQYGVSVAISGFLPGGGFIGFTGGLPYYPDPGRRFQWLVSPFSGLDPGVAALLTPPGPFFGAIIWNMKPRSVGSAYIVTDSPFVISDIRLNLYTDGDASDPLSDLSASIAAYKIARDWAHAIGQTIIWPPESHFIPGDDSKLAFDALSQVASATTSHYINTCAMGTSPTNSVVNGKLKVHGLENLYVADNSALTLMPDGNTCFPAYDVGAVMANILGAEVPQN